MTIVTFEDYQCEACAHTHKILKSLRTLYPERLNFIFRHYPLVDQHPDALKAALVVEDAALRGEFMQKHDELLENQSLLASLPEPTDSDSLMKKIKQDEADAKKLGVEGAPTTFVNGRNLGYVTDLETITKEIEKDILPISIKFSPGTTGAKTGSVTLSSGTTSSTSSFITGVEDITSKLPIKIIYESEGKTREQIIPADPVTNTGAATGILSTVLTGGGDFIISAYDSEGQEIAIYNGGVGSPDPLWHWSLLEKQWREQEGENPFNLKNPQYIFFIVAIILAILAWWKFRRR